MAKSLVILNILTFMLCSAVYGDDNKTQTGEVIVYTMKGPAREIASNLFRALRERGYFVNSYYPDEGVVSASKNIETSQGIVQAKNMSDNEAYKFMFSIQRRMSERVRKKIIFSSKAEQLNGNSKLTVTLKQGYMDWGEFKEIPITRDSEEYQDAAKILLKVKENIEAKYKSNE